MNPTIILDKGHLTNVVVCECGWREARGTVAAAWTSAARHLKEQHGNPSAAWAARTYARRAAARETAKGSRRA